MKKFQTFLIFFFCFLYITNAMFSGRPKFQRNKMNYNYVDNTQFRIQRGEPK